VNSLVERCNELIAEADRLFRSRDFDRALDNYRLAREDLLRALDLAQTRGFEVRSGIEESLGSLERSIRASLLGKGEELIEGGKSEDDIEEALRYLEGIEVPEEDKEELRRRARRRLLRLRLDRGRGMMERAEELSGSKEYVAAIEEYRRAKDYLGEVSAQATDFELLEEKSEADRLIAVCVDNARLLREELTGVARVEARVTPASEVARSEISREERRSTDPRELLRERYILLELVGEGGFAWVYRARKRETGEEVALKIFKSLSEEARGSFIREVEAWARLEHENIVRRRAWDFSPPFIEMELATSSLAKLKKPLPPPDACRYVFEVCRALNHAHGRGVYHRDLKPSNLLLFGDRVKVSDWGLARVSGHSLGFSLRELGTIYYMAPEQFKGEADGRTDIYQIGVVLFELLTGRRPFEGESEEGIMHRILSEAPPPPSSLNPDSSKVEPLVLRCLEKQKDRRYQSARELQLELADFLKEEYGLKLEFSRREEKSRWLSELLLVCLKVHDLPGSLGYARMLAEETGSPEIASLCGELEFRLKEKIGISEERIRELEALLRRFLF